MTSLQKIIKYVAIAFGIYLSIMIISMIVFGITLIFGISAGIDIYEESKETKQEIISSDIIDITELENLDIDLTECKLKIKKGETLKVEYNKNDSDFECVLNGKTLKIEDNGVHINWFNLSEMQSNITIYIPENIELNKVDIELGAADTDIEYLNCEELKINTGAGRCYIQNLITQDAKIECGAGETVIEESTIDTIKLDGGVGKTTITGEITKNADIDSGVGKLEVNLIGNDNYYKIKANTGLGNFTIDNKKVTDNQTIGTGDIDIEIDAGVGETIVSFIEERI